MSETDEEAAFQSADEDNLVNDPLETKPVASKSSNEGNIESPAGATKEKVGVGGALTKEKEGKNVSKDKAQAPAQSGKMSKQKKQQRKGKSNVNKTENTSAKVKVPKEVDTDDKTDKANMESKPGKDECASNTETSSERNNSTKDDQDSKQTDLIKVNPEAGSKDINEKESAESKPVTESSKPSSSEKVASGLCEPQDMERVREVTPTRKVERRSAPQHSDREEKILGKLEVAAEQKSGWGWGGWGSSWSSSLLNTAASSVATFTSQVGEGLNTMLETAEAALGAPDPEEVAQAELEEKQAAAVVIKDEPVVEGISRDTGDAGASEVTTESNDKKKSPQGATESKEDTTDTSQTDKKEEEAAGWDSDNWFASWGLSGITDMSKNLVANSLDVSKNLVSGGKTLVTGGLDVLETIGKKTYDAIAEGDHGLKETIRTTTAKPNLSQVLRDAKEEAEARAQAEEQFEEARQANFGSMFDEYQGLVHLEALEILSNQCEGKVHGLLSSLKGEKQDELKKYLVAIKEAFEIEEFDSDEDEEKDQDFAKLVREHVISLDLNASPDKLAVVGEKVRTWLTDCRQGQQKGVTKDPKDLHKAAIQFLAELTARAVEQFHKAGQLALIHKSTPTSYRDKADSLASLTRVLCVEVSIVSSCFTQCLNTAADNAGDPDAVNPLITNVYLEAGNSSTYIQDAYHLLLPVLQQAVIEAQADQ